MYSAFTVKQIDYSGRRATEAGAGACVPMAACDHSSRPAA
jgi:hypothetical protein